MRAAVWGAVVAAVAGIPAALAQEAPPPQAEPASAPQPDGSGVLVFPPSFFASARPNNAFEMIQRLPGFALDIGNLGTRGLAGAAGNVLIDGARPSSKNDSLDQILIRIAAASVERIELIRGGAPGIDMQGRTVVANVVLAKAATSELSVEVNTYAYPDGYFGPSGRVQYSRREGDKQTEASVFATRDRTENTAQGHRTQFDSAMAVTQQADLDLWDQFLLFNGRGALQRRVGGGKLRVNGALDYSDFDRRQDVTILSGAGSDAHNSDRQKTWSGELGATWTKPLGPRSELELTALQRATLLDDKSHSDFGGMLSTFGIDSTASESIARGIWRYRPSNAWAFEGGGEAAYNSLDSETAFTQAGVGVPLPNAKVLVTELRGELFGQATWRASGKLTIEAALRGEVSRIAQKGDTNASKSFLYPKPRLQVAWQPSPRHQLRFRVEERVGQLDFDQFAASTEVNLGTVVGGNADLVPQRDTLFEGVYEFRFWGKGAIELTGQHDLVRGIIDVIPLTGGFEAVGNIGSGTSDFAQARVTLPLDKLGIRNGLLKTRASWAWTRATDPLTGERRRFSGSAPFTCSAEFTHDLKGGRFSYGVVENCGRHWNNWRAREVRLTEMQGFLTAWGQWKPRKDLTVRLEVGNLLDMKLRVTRDIYPGARNSTALAMREVRETQQGRYAYLQVRKSL